MASGLVIAIIIGVIIISMGFAFYMYLLYQPNFIEVQAGEPIQVGPVKYIVGYEGEHTGNKDTQPEGTFFKIRITAENLDSETTILTGGQFFLLDESDKKYQAVYGKFSDEDLLTDLLELNVPVTWTTQFDIPYDEQEKYRIGILATKIQSSNDIGIVCVQNCN
ncbi:MAG: hypothetical protein V3T63_03060 [Nitrosopumilaceae archaeon]